MDQTDTLTYWLALKRINGLGIGGVKNLLDVLETPAAVFRASYAVLSAVPGIGKTWPGRFAISRTGQSGAGIGNSPPSAHPYHTVSGCDLSGSLKNIYDCPLLLYARGRWPLNGVCLAVVGPPGQHLRQIHYRTALP
jgi:predicted Rossmann fold nucleotide-binding protein DprA/Smf involved in DNA uptake